MGLWRVGLAHRALRLLGHLTRLRARSIRSRPYRWMGLPVVWSISTLRRVTGSAITVPANTSTLTVAKDR